MAAHTENLDTKYHYKQLATANVAYGFDGPPDAKFFWFRPSTGGAVCRAQVASPDGTGVTDGTTNIGTGADRGGTATTSSWNVVPASVHDAPPLPSRGSLSGPTVYVQTDTTNTDLEYRWSKEGAP